MKILIATDGSDFGQAAVNAACEIASGAGEGTELKVITVYEIPGPVAAEPFVSMPLYTQEVIDGLCKMAENTAESARLFVKSKCSASSVTSQVLMGKPAAMIVDEADEWKPDLIVVGSHGRGFWGRALIGSVSSAVIHHAKCSVLVVRLPCRED
jgi:nucleotide-binding universal stress UspA family protein